MKRKTWNIGVVLLTVVIVVAAVYWIAGHWELYARLLAGLWPLVVNFLIIIAALLESAWRQRFDRWYYESGPAIRRERWQTSGTDDQIREAIRSVFHAKGWAGREYAEGFFIRRRTWWNIGCRVLLRFEETDHGTAIRYEVRPLWQAPLWLAAVAVLFFSRFRVFFFVPALSWFMLPWAGLLIFWAVTYYVWLAPWEVRRLDRVKPIREALAAYRLGVCEKCGYDLFGHTEKSVCPECGTNTESS